MKRSITIAIALGLLGDCSQTMDSNPTPVVDELVVSHHDDTTFDATLRWGGETLAVLAVETEPQVVDLTFHFGDAVIAFRLDYTEGRGDFMPAGEPLDAASTRLLDEAGPAPRLVVGSARARPRVARGAVHLPPRRCAPRAQAPSAGRPMTC